MDKLGVIILCALPLTILSGCAIPVHQIKLAQPLAVSTEKHFVLERRSRFNIGTGYGRELHRGSRWNEVGVIPQGLVYRSPDQALTAEGYNVHEAYIVISHTTLVGLYLPVEKTFTPLSKSVELFISNTEEAQK